ncbi:hypothetical protein KID68_09140, partial [Escherichia coli]|nr:hypothetical protein [Escherichia coli]
QKKLIMLPSETMIWQPEFTDKTLSRKTGAVQVITVKYICQHRTYRGVFITGFQCSPVIKITATGKAQNMQ